MENVQQPQPKVGDSWYRYEDKWYSVADEWGEHSHSTLRVELWKYGVFKVTPKGVWIGWPHGEKKFIAHSWNKKYACATKEEALISLEARRKRQKSIYEARARSAGEVLLYVEMHRQELLNKEGY